jgi:hypothetical protein
MARIFSAILVAAALVWTILSRMGSVSSDKINTTGRTAVIASLQPEWPQLQSVLQHRQDRTINGIEYATGEIKGKPVLLP